MTFPLMSAPTALLPYYGAPWALPGHVTLSFAPGSWPHHGTQWAGPMCPTGRGRGPCAHASEEALRHSGSAGCSSPLFGGQVYSLQLLLEGGCFLKGGAVVCVACRWARWRVGVYELP